VGALTVLTILITGFGRFPGSPVNPSGIVAARLARRRRPLLDATKRIGHVFATRYAAVDRELPALLARERPDVVVLFGVAGRTRRLRIEERARNRVSVLFPDAGGQRPEAPAIVRGAAARRSSIPPERLVTAARASGVAAMRSRNAGTYLCNYAYWRALESVAAPGGPKLAIFVHVPPVRAKAKPRAKLKRRGRPLPGRRRLGIGDLLRGGEAILIAVIALARAPHMRRFTA
jgi:pyroglutamyl-peptidase